MTPQLLLFLRLVKLLAVIALFIGTVGAFLPGDLADRRRAAYAIAGPGFCATWLLGFSLAAYNGVSITSSFIVAALPLSLFSLQVVLFSVGREGRRSWLTALMAVLPLVTTVALMVWKPGVGPSQ